MPMNRGIWLILAAVVLVLIGLFVWPTINRTPEAPPAAQPPAAATGVQPPAKDAGSAGSAQTSEQKSVSVPAPEAAVQPAQKETSPAPQPGTAAPSQTAEKETPPTPAATAPTGAAPTSEKETAPASSSAPAVQTAPKEAAPPSAPQPAAAPTAQTAEKESAPFRSVAGTSPAAPAGEKAPVATDKDAEPHANDKASAELAALQPGFVPKDLVAALNDSVISFASDSADVPAEMTDFLQKAAEDLKQLPKGHVVEIAGYTDNSGDQALNLALSQKRAEAVRQTLIKFGADPETLIAKGFGSADPVASNDTPEGRRRNRRIEYHIINSPGRHRRAAQCAGAENPERHRRRHGDGSRGRQSLP